MDCVFCKIAQREIPANVVYEDQHFLAFMDIHPTVKGHVLIMPKTHYPEFDETPEEVIAELFKRVRKLMPLVVKGVGAEGFNLGVNGGPVAGQVIMHTHVHLLPRWSADGKQLWGSGEYGSGELEQYWQKIKAAVEANGVMG